MSWLIITHPTGGTFNEHELWGMGNWDYGIAITNQGAVKNFTKENYVKVLKQGYHQFIILNGVRYIEKEFPEEMKKFPETLKNSFESIPECIWVHFGELLSNDASWESIVSRWLIDRYSGLRDLFPDSKKSLPLSYSLHSDEEWDIVLKELADDVKKSIDGKKKLNVDAYESKLKEAKAKAYNSYKGEKIFPGINKGVPRVVMTTLFPIFIYFDGLAYIRDNNSDNRKELLTEIRKRVPNILEKINIKENTEAIEKMVNVLRPHFENGSPVSDNSILEAGKAFCHEYKKLTKKFFSINP